MIGINNCLQRALLLALGAMGVAGQVLKPPPISGGAGVELFSGANYTGTSLPISSANFLIPGTCSKLPSPRIPISDSLLRQYSALAVELRVG